MPWFSPQGLGLIFCAAATTFFLPATLAAQDASVEAQEATSRTTEDEQFILQLGGKQDPIWGVQAQAPTKYFAEFLPAYFTRDLMLTTDLPANTGLEWVFTGPRGGITVTIDAKAVTLRQRYYDSVGLVPASSKPLRYPVATWKTESYSLGGLTRVITVSIEGMSVILKVDGVELLRQQTLIDLTRHHVRVLVGADRDAAAASDRARAAPSVRDDLALTLRRPVASAATVAIDSSERHQTIMGFGGIVSFPAYEQMDVTAREKWLLRLHEDNLLVQREYPTGSRLKPDLSNFETVANALPHYYGDNWPNGETSNFDFSRRIRQLGGKVIFEFWRLPDWVQNPQTKAIRYDEYVRAVVGYCKEAQRRTGQPPEIVGIQNEIIQTADAWSEMIRALRLGLDQAGFGKVAIHMPDAVVLSAGIGSARTLRQDATAWRLLDYSAVHFYDYQDHFGDPDAMAQQFATWKQLTEGKPFLATELAINQEALQAVDSYKSAFAQTLLYHYLLTRLDAVLLAYCWVLLDVEQPTFGSTRSLYTVDREQSFDAAAGVQRRGLAAFSRRLPEGIIRVGAVSSDPGLLASAYAAEGVGQTLILLNRSTAPKRVQITGASSHFTVLERTSAYDNVKAGPVPAGSAITVNPGEIVTLSNVPLRTEIEPRRRF